MSTAAEIAPTYDFAQLTLSLRSSPDANLGTLLSELAKIPAPTIEQPVVKKADPVAAENLNGQLLRSVEALPKVFGKVNLPVSRRALNKVELAGLVNEKEEISAAKRALVKREALVTQAVSVHFDVVAERDGAATDGETPVDKNGHYLIGGSSAAQRQEARVPGIGGFFTREKSADKVDLSFEKLLVLYETGQISRKDFLGMTREVTHRVIDEGKIRRGLLSSTRRKHTQEIVRLIGVVTHGTLSINLRK